MLSSSGVRISSAPQGANDLLAFFAHALGHDNAHLIALEPADQGHANARVAAGGFDDDRAGTQPAVALGPVEHGQGHAVLDAPAGIEKFRLAVDLLPPQTHQRRVADQFEDVVSEHGNGIVAAPAAWTKGEFSRIFNRGAGPAEPPETRPSYALFRAIGVRAGTRPQACPKDQSLRRSRCHATPWPTRARPGSIPTRHAGRGLPRRTRAA